MPNARVQAAAEGLPAPSRRSFLTTASVAGAASLPGCSLMSPAAASILKAAPYVPAVADPLAALIAAYRDGCIAFNARAKTEEWDELEAETFGPALEILMTVPPEPNSAAGVRAAIALTLTEPELFAVGAVLKACLRYLEREARS